MAFQQQQQTKFGVKTMILVTVLFCAHFEMASAAWNDSFYDFFNEETDEAPTNINITSSEEDSGAQDEVLYIEPEDLSKSSYDNIKALRDSLLSSDKYSSALRPVLDQRHTISIKGFYSLVTIVSLDDVRQELITNGYFSLFWQDERRAWNTDNYEQLSNMELRGKDVWTPRMYIVNALSARDPFGSHESYTALDSRGGTTWQPGGLFHTYCEMNLKKYPFDTQVCEQQLCAINHDLSSLEFELETEVDLSFHFPNSAWDFVHAYVKNKRKVMYRGLEISCPTLHFEIKRRPTTIILNVILPVVLLSLLNNFVFLIPLESGENIGFAITVLLSMTVYLSTVSSLTPQVSNVVPSLTIYLFVLFLMSVITVGAVIFTENRHHQDEIRSQNVGPDGQPLEIVGIEDQIRSALGRSNSYKVNESAKKDGEGGEEDKANSDEHKHKRLARRVNVLLFVIVTAIWTGSTLFFFGTTYF